MTGRSVTDIRQSRFSASLNPEIPVYPEMLRQGGYYTGLCGRSYHTDGSGRKAEITEKVFAEYNLVSFPRRLDYVRRKSKDEEVILQVREFLDQAPPDKPWFLQAGFSDPHRKFTAPGYAPDPASITVPPGMPDTEKLREDLAAHYGEINRLDVHVGQLISELDKRGLKDRTLIVFMGDNGAAIFRGKGTLWDTGLHVPLVARLPGVVPAGSVSRVLISGEDIAPTFLDAAGIAPDKKMTGKSFWPVLKGSEEEIRNYAFAVRGAHGSGLPTSTDRFDLSRSVFNKEYRLIYNALWQLPFSPVDFHWLPFWQELVELNEAGKLDPKYRGNVFADPRPMFELYDLKNDPQEFNNLAGRPEYADIEKRLKAEMQRWMILTWDVLPLPIPPGQ
jgi:arylsulfatase A-like enzyme